jgi:vitamin B12 transporter
MQCGVLSMTSRLPSLIHLLSTSSAGALALMLLAPAPAAAETQLQEIVVESAQLGGTSADAAASGSAYSVVTHEEIERRQIRHAADALRALPGVQISRYSGGGSLTDLRIRGSETNHTKVLIDGVEVSGLSSGSFDFATLLAADIERIEVLRGPQSGIYGGNALAGVVNIITRKHQGPAQVSVSGEGGSFNSHELSGNVSTGIGDGYVSLSGARRETDGFNIADHGGETDGSTQSTAFLRAGYVFSPAFRIDGMLRNQSNRTENDEDNLPASPWGPQFAGDNILEDTRGIWDDRQQRLGNLTGTLTLFDGFWVQKLQGSFLNDDLESQSFKFGRSTAAEERFRWSYFSQLNFGTADVKHSLGGQVELTDEAFASSNITGERKIGQEAYVGEYRLALYDRLFLSGDLRRDDNEEFADQTTYRIGSSYKLLETDSRLHGSYGRGIKNPTMVELYGTYGSFTGNPNLKTEESIGWDAGIEQALLDHRLVFDATYFAADLNNEISADYTVVPTVPINLNGTSHRQGIELTATAHLTDALMLTGNYTYTDSRKPKGDHEGRRPFNTAGANLSYVFADNRAKVGIEAIYNGQSIDVGKNYAAVVVPDYTLVNLTGSYQLADNVELFARAENLFDHKYEEIWGYNATPFAAYAGMKVKLEAAN